MWAIRTCWDSFDKSDNMKEKDLALIDRVANKNKHASTIEHINYTYKIEGISRALLQELARHRHASFSVKSSRYTLKEIKGLTFIDGDIINTTNLERFCVISECAEVNEYVARAMQNLSDLLSSGLSNDVVKLAMPEAYKVDLVFTINARSLQNLIALRHNKSAFPEFQRLALAFYNNLPQSHKYLFELKEI